MTVFFFFACVVPKSLLCLDWRVWGNPHRANQQPWSSSSPNPTTLPKTKTKKPPKNKQNKKKKKSWNKEENGSKVVSGAQRLRTSTTRPIVLRQQVHEQLFVFNARECRQRACAANFAALTARWFDIDKLRVVGTWGTKLGQSDYPWSPRIINAVSDTLLR